MALAKCVFCGKEQEDFKGNYYIKNDGTMNYFCTSKCQKSQLKLKRDKKRFRWTERFHIMREKRINREKERAEKLKLKSK